MTFNRISSFCALCAVAVLIGELLLLTDRNFVSENPYEESAMLTALRMSFPCCSSQSGWSEHPPLACMAFTLLERAAGSHAKEQLRWLSILSYMGAFAFTTALLTTSAPHWSRRSKEVSFDCDWWKAMCSLAIFSMPALLMHGNRVESEALAFLSTAVAVWAATSIVEGGGWRYRILLACGVLALTWATCYGVVVAIAILTSCAATLGLIGVGRRRDANGSIDAESCPGRTEPSSSIELPGCSRTRSLAGPITSLAIVMCLVVLSSLCPAFHLAQRISHLSDHYWALPTRGETIHMLFFGFVWSDFSVLQFMRHQAALESVHAVVLGVIACVMVTSRASSRTFVAGLSAILSSILLLILQAAVGSPLLVVQFLGCVLLLYAVAACLAIYDLFGGLGIRFLGAAGLLIITIPSLASLWQSGASGERALAEVTRHIKAMATDSDRVLFAGSRAYVLAYPRLPDGVIEKSTVFFREGTRPDNFTGRSLVPSDQRCTIDSIHREFSRRVCYVQLEAAQSVRCDLSPWNVGKVAVVPHPCNSIGIITIIELIPRDPGGNVVSAPRPSRQRPSFASEE